MGSVSVINERITEPTDRAEVTAMLPLRFDFIILCFSRLSVSEIYCVVVQAVIRMIATIAFDMRMKCLLSLVDGLIMPVTDIGQFLLQR
jgi:hypothetical protein